jgi:Co/Zn/Cd efflux system component
MSLATDLDPRLAGEYRAVYVQAALLSIVVIAIEISGALLSGSFALRADVWHVAGDLLIALTPVVISLWRGARARLSMLSLFGGVVVAGMLIAIGCTVLWEAASNLYSPTLQHEIHGWLLSAFALASAGANFLQHRLLSRVHSAHRDIAHQGFQFHVRMDLVKNLALPLLGVLLALGIVPQRTDSWAAACIGAWIVARGLVLLTRSVASFRKSHLPDPASSDGESEPVARIRTRGG